MKKIGKTLIAMAMVSLLFGCGGQQQETAESEQFVVGMECSYAPFNWQTSQESETTVSLGNAGYADGYDVQIAKRIADDLGKELVIKKISWDGLSVALESGEIDAIIAGMKANETREEGIVHFDEGKGFECDTTVSIGLKEGTRDSEFFKQVQVSLDKITVDERKQLMSEAVNRQPAGE